MRLGPSLFIVAALIVSGYGLCRAQSELLPVDHPATQALVRACERGAVPGFPCDHLPVSRAAALAFMNAAIADTALPALMRDQLAYYRIELAADTGNPATAVFIRTTDKSVPVYDHPFSGMPLAITWYRDSAGSVRVSFEPVLSAEFRIDPSTKEKVLIAQGGANLRGSIGGWLGFSARITNGTIAGDSLLALRDPVIGRAGKYALARYGKDIDFGSGHLRADMGVAFAELGREKIQLGGGQNHSLLLGSDLPSDYDYLRLGVRFPKVQFTHIHAALLSEPLTPQVFSVAAHIPSKYVAAHLLTIGPFAGARLSVGESVVYTGRPLELGYLNPLNFFKSQEHYLRDRDNSFMYAALSLTPLEGLFLEGEYLLDDLKFSRIGKKFWGNKGALRLNLRGVGLLNGMADAGLAYTRVEPFTYTHFDSLNSYTHDATGLSAGGLPPNAYNLEATLNLYPLGWLHIALNATYARHGKNITAADGTMIRNVGGDIQRTIDTTTTYDPVQGFQVVSFLDGVIEESLRLWLNVEYEILRNVYLRTVAVRNSLSTNGAKSTDNELWIGLRVGAH